MIRNGGVRSGAWEPGGPRRGVESDRVGDLVWFTFKRGSAGAGGAFSLSRLSVIGLGLALSLTCATGRGRRLAASQGCGSDVIPVQAIADPAGLSPGWRRTKIVPSEAVRDE